MAPGAAQAHFVNSVIPAFRSALIGRDAIVQARGELFITVVNETTADRVFEFDLQFGGMVHRIQGEFQDDGKTRIITSSGKAQDYATEALTRKEVKDIVATWWSAIEASRSAR